MKWQHVVVFMWILIVQFVWQRYAIVSAVPKNKHVDPSFFQKCVKQMSTVMYIHTCIYFSINTISQSVNKFIESSSSLSVGTNALHLELYKILQLKMPCKSFATSAILFALLVVHLTSALLLLLLFLSTQWLSIFNSYGKLHSLSLMRSLQIFICVCICSSTISHKWSSNFIVTSTMTWFLQTSDYILTYMHAW